MLKENWKAIEAAAITLSEKDRIILNKVQERLELTDSEFLYLLGLLGQVAAVGTGAALRKARKTVRLSQP